MIAGLTPALCAVLTLVTPSAARQAAPMSPSDTTSHRFELTDLRRIVSLSDPRISPDGRRVALLVSRPDWKTDKPEQELDLVDVASGARRTVTFDRTELSHPRWSPEGTRLAFLAADSAKHAQVFVMRMDGGDPVRITDSRTGVDEFSWSPDGRTIAFVAEDTVPNPKEIKHHEDGFRVTDNAYTTRAAVQPWHLWIVPADGGTPRRLTSGTWSLNTDQGTMDPLAWTRDGRSVAFTRFPDTYFGTAFKSTIAEVDTAGGEVRTLVAAEGAVHPTFAPGATTLAFMRPRGGDQNNGNAVYVASGQGATDVTAALAQNIGRFAWLPGDSSLLLAGDLGTRAVFWRQPLDGAATRVDLGGVEVGRGMSVARDGAVAFLGDTPAHPDELYVLPAAGGPPRRLTDYNAWMDSLELGRVDTLAWKGPGGFAEDGVLVYPVGYRPGHRDPLVLVIHGGPEGASTIGFSALPQLLAARGFFVFEPNYRGSINLGDRYQHAIFRDTGEGPGKDVMAGLAAVERLGVVDPARIGVTGWSYGGYMTTWLEGHYDVWKAAVAGAALTDWVMDYTIAFYQQGDLYFFGGSPWVARTYRIWRDQSPIKYAASVKAPTLIMGDVGDPNVPIVNSYEWFHALRDNGVVTEFYAYPADVHFPHDIVRTTDIYRRWIDWMEKYLK